MKNLILASVSKLLGAAIFLAATATPGHLKGQISNGGFESMGSNWVFTKAATENSPFAFDAVYRHSGAFSFKVSHTNTNSYSRATQKIAVASNSVYTLSGFIKTTAVVLGTGGVGARLFVGRGSDGSTLAASPITTGTTAWAKQILTFQTENETNIQIIPYLHLASGTAWFDDLLLTPTTSQPLDGTNLALGKALAMSPAPNYSLTTDSGDPWQLTDGVFVPGSNKAMWFYSNAVGFTEPGILTLKLDLGAVTNIKTIGFNTCGSKENAGVYFPDAFFYVSDNGYEYRFLGSFSGLDYAIKPQSYPVKYQLEGLSTRGRYILVCATPPAGSFVFADELEVIEGTNTNPPRYGDTTLYSEASAKAAVFANQAGRKMRAMLIADIDECRSNYGFSFPTASQGLLNLKNSLIALTSAQVTNLTLLSNYDQKVSLTNGEVARLRFPGKPFVVWAKDRWAPLGKRDMAPADLFSNSALVAVMAQNEVESMAVTVQNTGSSPLTLQTSLTPLTNSGTNTLTVKWRTAVFTESSDLKNDGDALPLFTLGPTSMVIPVGEARQIWIFIENPQRVGTFSGSLTLAAGTENKVLPLQVTVKNLTIAGNARAASTHWAYLSAYPVANNQTAALSDLKAHGTTIAMVSPGQLPKFAYDLQGGIISENYAAFDSNIDHNLAGGMTEIGLFMAFGNYTGTLYPFGGFAGPGSSSIAYQSPAWHAAMRNAMTRTIARLIQKGVGYDRFFFYPFDEAHGPVTLENFTNIGREIKTIDSNVQVFATTTSVTALSELTAMAPYVSRWCPHFKSLNTVTTNFYAQQKAIGKKVYLYRCEGPSKTLSPNGYFRNLPWSAWANGYDGCGTWAYCDIGGVGTAWSDFDGKNNDFHMVYDAATAPTGISRVEVFIPSKRWEAWRDGMEDYALLQMLKNAIAQAKLPQSGKSPALIAAAEGALAAAVGAVGQSPEDSQVYETQHRALLDAILSLQ